MRTQGITQEALASDLGRGQSWLNHKLSGRRKANVEDVILIAQALGVEPAELLNSVTNHDKMTNSFLSIAENRPEYKTDLLARLETKFSQLNDEELEQFFVDIEDKLDQLLITKAKTEYD